MFPAHIDLKATKIALMQSKFHRFIKHRLAVALRPFELQAVDWIVLGFLEHRKQAMVISDVATEIGVQPSFMTTIIAKLVKRGLITVKDDTSDHRRKHITLTSEGTKVVKLMQKQFEEFFTPFIRGLSKTEVETYLKVLKTVIANVEESDSLK